MASKQKSWKQTKLWKELKKRDSSNNASHEASKEIIGTVRQSLQKAEAVLSKSHTSPLDFTLHDEEHSFRVAERMIELIPASQIKHFSDYEIALLLLAAYMHDIGMTPERHKVTSIHNYLLTKAPKILTEAEAIDIQHWMDGERHTDVLPLCPEKPTQAQIHRADFLTAFYARHKHNEWSAEWMHEHLSGEFHCFSDWKETLILLCQSHHFNHAALRDSRFDPRPIGSSQPQRVHLRHLACILRVADIIENDPERVPEIVFQHRDIAEKSDSILHWYIPHEMTIIIHGDRVAIHARPRSARAQKAIYTLSDAIDSELAGCHSIYDQMGFDKCPPLPDLKREWPLQAAATRDIQPRDSSFVYIEGAFRPRTDKLLQLLSGTQLYDTKLAAIRELIQNSFDAIREKIARYRLKKDNPADESWVEHLGALESVTLILRTCPKDGKLHLICRDTGTGMTRAIIENHLLVSGDGHRSTIIELERRCKESGFTIGRTGQFGIGVLSYFMLASEVCLTTCRLQDCGDLDAPGWTFTTHGVGDFGELKRLAQNFSSNPGTEIEWTLVEGSFKDLQDATEQIERYLRSVLIKIPCRFRFEVERNNKKDLKIDFLPGWTHAHEHIKKSVTKNWQPSDDFHFEKTATASIEQLQDQEAFKQRYPGWLSEAHQSLKIAEETASLPGAIGTVRVVLPWFDLREGASLTYLCHDRAQGGRVYGDDYILHPHPFAYTSWRGISTDVALDKTNQKDFCHLYPRHCAWISWDFSALPDSYIHVHRSHLTLPQEVAKECHLIAFELLFSMAEKLLENSSHPSYYGILSNAVLNRKTKLLTDCGWMVGHGKHWHFEKIKLPVFMRALEPHTSDRFIWEGKVFSGIRNCVVKKGNLSRVTLDPQIGRIMSERPRGTPLDRLNQAYFAFDLDSDHKLPTDMKVFPPEWADVAGIMSIMGTQWNINHWIFQILDPKTAASVMMSIDDDAFDWSIFEPHESLAANCILLLKAVSNLDGNQLKALMHNNSESLRLIFLECAKFLNKPPESFRLLFLKIYEWNMLSIQQAESAYYDIGSSSWIPTVTDSRWLVDLESDAQ